MEETFEGEMMDLHELVLFGLESTILAPAFKFYDIGGKRLFDIRGPMGGVATCSICYIIPADYKAKIVPRYAIEIIKRSDDSLHDLESIVKLALQQFVIQLCDKTAKTVDMDGGDLGRANY